MINILFICRENNIMSWRECNSTSRAYITLANVNVEYANIIAGFSKHMVWNDIIIIWQLSILMSYGNDHNVFVASIYTYAT